MAKLPQTSRVLLLFVDGVGLGRPDPAVNPFAATKARHLAPLAGGAPAPGWSLARLDATLGVAGLPQSATGQTTLLTGVNAARHAGRHLTGVPGPSLRPLLARDSVFHRVLAAGLDVTFANAYTPRHLHAERPRWSATTRAALGAGLELRMVDPHAFAGTALYHDWAGGWTASHDGPDVPRHTADSAAAVLTGLLERHDLVVYEYFLTDLAGHRGTDDDRRDQARRVEALIVAVLQRLDPARHVLALVSDHGNLEDSGHRRHTLNAVPLLAWGARAPAVTNGRESLVDVPAALLAGLGISSAEIRTDPSAAD